MSRSLLILLTFLSAGALSAQILISDHSGQLSNDQVVTLTEAPGGTDIIAHFKITNASQDSTAILCKKAEIELISGSSNSFCWTQCYPPFTYVSPTPLVFAPGAADSLSFAGEYYPNGNAGQSTIAYTFFNEKNPDDSVRVKVQFAFNMVGLEERFARGEFLFSPAYPNPAASKARFDFRLPEGIPATLHLRNLLGSEVARTPLNDAQGVLSLDVSTLTDGVYFYTLVVGPEAVVTRKLVVKH